MKYVKTFEGYHDELYNYAYIIELLSKKLEVEPAQIDHYSNLFEEYSDTFEYGMSEEEYIVNFEVYLKGIWDGSIEDPMDDQFFD